MSILHQRVGENRQESQRYQGGAGWRLNQGSIVAAVLLMGVLFGCAPEQQPSVGATGSAQVNLNITMPQNVATVATPQNKWVAILHQWFLATEAWAQSVRDISTLVVQVTGPGISSPITARQQVTGATGGQVIPVTLDVPVGPERVFKVSGLGAGNVSILQGESAPITLQAGRTETVNISLRNISAPTAKAGLDQGDKLPGARITLDGSASSDPNGDQLIYQWSFTTRPSGSQAVLVNPTAVSPTFTVDRAGEYVIQLIVNDGRVDSPPDTVTISSSNVPPVAEAGPDQGGKTRGARITLDGSASSDSNGDPLTYRWAFTARPTGSQAVLVNPTAISPTFTTDQDGDYKIQLIVNDGTMDSPPDTVTITSTNVAPVANAGPDQAGAFPAGTVITLDGSGSSDVNGDPLAYRWAFTNRPTGSQAALSNPTSVRPTFTIDRDGDYIIQLIVNDRRVDSPSDTVLVTGRNIAPVANGGPDQGDKLPGALITLNGSDSFDPNGNALTYRWAFTARPTGSQAVLANPTTVSPTFTVDRDGDYVVQLIVNDGTLDSPADTVIVNSGEILPVANAGPDQTVTFPDEGPLTVTLDGSASSDPNGDPLTFRWSFTSSPPADGDLTCEPVLTNATSARPSFSPDCVGTYVLQLIVNDGTVNSPPDTVTVTVNSRPAAPVANAGPDQTVTFPTDDAVTLTVTLDGSSSSDANGDPLTHRWSFTTVPEAFEGTCEPALNTATSVRPTFSPFCSGTYVIQLIVNDGTADSEADSVGITVNSPPPPPSPPQIN